MTQQRIKKGQIKLDFQKGDDLAETFAELTLAPADFGKVEFGLFDLKYMAAPLSLVEYAAMADNPYAIANKGLVDDVKSGLESALAAETEARLGAAADAAAL